MEGTAKDIPVIDWLEFPSATDKEVQWNVHLPFMLSHWNCIFGRGCPGVIFKEDTTHQPGKGCCFDGAYINTETEFKRIEGYVAQLTEEDLDAENLAVIKEKGYAYHFTQPGQEDPDDPDTINAKTRVYKGRCILSRSDGGGCSLLHLAGRQTGKGANNVPHTMTMPDVCWQLPIKRDHVWNEELEREVITLYPWDADAWETDQMEWWCVSEGTLITTDRGQVPIEEVSEEDRVLTRDGLRKVLRRWDNGERAVVEVVHERGSLVVTEDHELLTTEGFLTAREIVTRAANAVSTVGPDVGVLGRVLVPLGASGSPAGSERLSTPDVLPVGDAVEMPDVAADAIAAQMVQLVTLGNGTVDVLPNVDSHVAGNTVQLRHAVSTTQPLAAERDAVESVDEIGVDERLGVKSSHVLNIHQVGTARVFDLSVEGKPEYVANGVVVHNCVDDSAAYTSKEPLYITMEQELRVLMGDTDYETLAVECERRYVNRTARKMPAELPDGVTLIPLAIKGRTQTAP